MAITAGIDGCKAGWLCVLNDSNTGEIEARILKSVCELLSLPAFPDLVTIDIPIGLPATGARECDLLARAALKPKRSSSVFPCPLRCVLRAKTFRKACDLSAAVHGKKLSQQCYALLGKIAEVDHFVRQDLTRQMRFREVHPEICFWAWNGKRPMEHPKKSEPGSRERELLVEASFPGKLEAAKQQLRRRDYQDDDLLDAFAALWTADRVLRNTHLTLPAEPPTDEVGLRMEMVA